VMGDFNHDILKTDGRISKFLNDFISLNLQFHSKNPTNFQGNPTCINKELRTIQKISNFSTKLIYQAYLQHMIFSTVLIFFLNCLML
jgi:hypothetical protein